MTPDEVKLDAVIFSPEKRWYTRRVRSQADSIRLGHALEPPAHGGRDGDAVLYAVNLANGDEALEPRPPRYPEVVLAAERKLGADPRPIYAFVGGLHPGLGQVGLVISRTWAVRGLQGVTRCDSGGLSGRKGGFECLTIDEADRSHSLLSTPATCAVAEWGRKFSDEIQMCHGGSAGAYVDGELPITGHWDGDVRARCIRYSLEKGWAPDRRLWTWELRIEQPPHAEEVYALVVSNEAHKRIEALHSDGIQVHERVKILFGQKGSHCFAHPLVRAALRGSES